MQIQPNRHIKAVAVPGYQHSPAAFARRLHMFWLFSSWLLALWMLALWVLALWVLETPAAAADVYIVDTEKRDSSRALAEKLNANCALCQPIKYMDMDGRYSTGQLIADELKQREEVGALDLVIAFGRPAALAVLPNIKNTPLFIMMGDPLRPVEGRERVLDFTSDPPASLQLETLKRLVPGAGTIGFIATNPRLDVIREEILAASLKLGVSIKFYYVADPFDVPDALRRAIKETDGLVFVRDRRVLNSDTKRYILRMTLENQVPTIGFSDKLVRNGMMAALALDLDHQAKLMAQVAQQLLEAGQLPGSDLSGKRSYVLSVNKAALEQFPDIVLSAPEGVEVIMR